MDQILPPPEDEGSLGALMRRASAMALGLLVLARAALARFAGDAPPALVTRRVLRRFIVPAEAIVRRAVLVLAASMALPVTRPRAASAAQGRRPPPPSATRPRAPVFCLTEPVSRQFRATRPTAALPRITLMDASAPRRTPAVKDPVAEDARFAARLLRRMVALENAYVDPAREARRFLRRRARALAASGGAPLRPPLAFVRIPGDGPHLLTPFRHVLEDMNRAAAETLFTRPNLPDTS